LSSGPSKKTPAQKNFLSSGQNAEPGAGGSDSVKASAGGSLSALEQAILPEGNVLEIVFNCLTNYFDYYKVKTHTKRCPLSGLNMLNFFMK
jgi:hypothetical protein